MCVTVHIFIEISTARNRENVDRAILKPVKLLCGETKTGFLANSGAERRQEKEKRERKQIAPHSKTVAATKKYSGGYSTFRAHKSLTRY